jgi:hypothetical protein
MKKHRVPPACVIIQTPAYGTISWGPFPNRDAAQQWVDEKNYVHELYAAYETEWVSGIVIMVVTLYDPDVSDLK